MRLGEILAIGLIIIVLVLILRGLNENKIEKRLTERFESRYTSMQNKGAEECVKRGLKFIGVSSSNTIQFKAWCMQESPVKVHEVTM